MKKLFCVMLAALFLLGAASCGTGGKETPAESAPPETAPADVPTTETLLETTVPTEEPAAAKELTAEIAERYLDVIDGLYQKYGEGHISDNGDWLIGFAFIRLMDLDGDGVEEMICAYENPERGEFFPYVNEYAVYGPDIDEPLFDPQPVCNFGNGDAPGLGFLTKDGKVYLENYEGGLRVSYSHLENGSLQTDISFAEEEDFENGTVTAWLNGEEKDSATAYAVLEGFEAAGQKEEIDFFDYERTGALARMLSDTNMTRYRLETLCGRAD